MKSFSGAKKQDLEQYVTPHLEHGKPDIVAIQVRNIGQKMYRTKDMIFISEIRIWQILMIKL